MGSFLNIGKKAGEALGGSLFTAANQLVTSTASGVASILAAPSTAGQRLSYDGSGLIWAADGTTGPTGTVSENFPRAILGSTTNLTSALVSQRLLLMAVPLRAGQTVSTVSFWAGTTALSAGSNQWAALFTSALAKVAISSDATSAAWSADTKKTFTFTSAYLVPTSGLYYVGLLVNATTVPTLHGVTANNGAIVSEAPMICGTADTGITTTASCPSTAAALTAQNKIPYCYLT